MMTVEVPEALEKEPLSPVLASQLDTIVPSGSWLTGKILPTERAAIYSIINILKEGRRGKIGIINTILTLGTGVDELTSVEAFNSDEILSSVLVLVWVSENNFGKRSSTAWVVNDFLYNSLDVPNRIKDERSAKLTLLSRRNQEF